MTTTQNIAYFEQNWAGGVPLPDLSKANQDAYETVRELTENFSDMAMIEADPAFEKMFGYLCDALRRSDGEGPVKAQAKKKAQSAASKARAAKTARKGRGVRSVKKTAKADGKSFAQRMKAARDGKRVSANQPAADGPQKKENVKSAPKPKATATPKAKAAKQPTKAERELDAYASAQKAGTLTEETRQIRRFISLVKKSTKDAIVSAAIALNKAITQRKITKTSPHAGDIEFIQQRYFEATKSPYKLAVSDSKLAELVAIAGGQRVYKSIELLSRFLGWAEKERTHEQVKAFLKELQNAAPKIKPGDPYAEQIKAVIRLLSGVKSKATFHLTKTPLSGLAGLMGGLIEPQRAVAGLSGVEPVVSPRTPVPVVVAPSVSVPVPAAAPVVVASPAGPLVVKPRYPAVMSAHQVAAINYPTYNFNDDPRTNDWGTLIGRPQNPFAMMISGEPGAGKSTLMMQLAVYLAKNFGPTRYVSSEEYPSLTLADKLERAGGAVKDLSFSRDLSELSKDTKFVIIDSTNHVKISLPQFLELRRKFPATSFILIMQYTKDGQFKGGNEWPHEVDAVFRVVRPGKVLTDKNRFVRDYAQNVTVFKND